MKIDVWPRQGRQTSIEGGVRHNSHIQDGRFILQNWLLYDFNIDGNILKPLHEKILNEYIVRTLRTRPCHVILKGRASASGNAQYNQKLSESRVLQVKKFLLSKGFSESQVPGSQMRAYGEQYSDQKNPDNPLDRAVHVIIRTGLMSRGVHLNLPPDYIYGNEHIYGWPPPPPNVPEPAVSWSIYYYQGRSVTLGYYGAVEITRHDFLLKDHANKDIYSCFYRTETVSGGKGPQASGFYIEGSGHWKTFTTVVPRKIADFTGSTKWITGSGSHTIEFGKKEIVQTPVGSLWGVAPLNPNSSGNNVCKKL